MLFNSFANCTLVRTADETIDDAFLETVWVENVKQNQEREKRKLISTLTHKQAHTVCRWPNNPCKENQKDDKAAWTISSQKGLI